MLASEVPLTDSRLRGSRLLTASAAARALGAGRWIIGAFLTWLDHCIGQTDTLSAAVSLHDRSRPVIRRVRGPSYWGPWMHDVGFAPAASIRRIDRSRLAGVSPPQASATTCTFYPSARAESTGKVTHSSVNSPETISFRRPVATTAARTASSSHMLCCGGRSRPLQESRRESKGSGERSKPWWRTWTPRSASRNGWQCAIERSRCSAAFGDQSILRRKQVRLADRRQCAILRLDQDVGLSQFEVLMSSFVNSGHRGVLILALASAPTAWR